MDILAQANMLNCKSARTPGETSANFDRFSPRFLIPHYIGVQFVLFSTSHSLSLNLAMWFNRIFLYMHNPQELHFTALQHILRYVPVVDHCLQVFNTLSRGLVAYSYVDQTISQPSKLYFKLLCVSWQESHFLVFQSQRSMGIFEFSVMVEYHRVANAIIISIDFRTHFLYYITNCYYHGYLL